MSIKIEKIGNTLVITDTDLNKTLADTPSAIVYYDVDILEKANTIRIFNMDQNIGLAVHRNFADYLLTDTILDAGDTAYTIASFKDFARNNLGPPA